MKEVDASQISSSKRTDVSVTGVNTARNHKTRVDKSGWFFVRKGCLFKTTGKFFRGCSDVNKNKKKNQNSSQKNLTFRVRKEENVYVDDGSSRCALLLCVLLCVRVFFLLF